MSEVNNEMIQSVLQIIKSVSKSEIIQQAVSQQPVPSLFDKLPPGQQLQATVLNPDFEGKVLLRIANEKVLIDTLLQLKPGQHLNVEVSSRQPGMVQLKVIDMPTQASVQAQFLKINLPIQEPLTALLKQLSSNLSKPSQSQNPPVANPQAQLRQTNSRAGSKIPEPVQTLANRILSQIPTAAEFKNPGAFEKLLADSGIFMESRLLRGQATNQDTKAGLLRIAEQLRTSLTQNQTPGSAATTNRTANTMQAAQQFQANIPAAAAPRPAATMQVNMQANPNPPTTPLKTSKEPQIRTDAALTAGVDNRPIVTPSNGISQLKGVTEKGSLTATQAAQKAMMLGKANPATLTRSITPNLLNNTAFLQALDLLPKTEFNLLLKQLLFKKSISAQYQQSPLNALLRSTPMGLLLKAVESSLARIHTQQLASVPQEDTTRQIWQMEIPIRDQKELSSLMMRIEQDDSEQKNDTQGSTWTVCLNFNISELGPVHSKVRLTQEVVSTHFWAEQQDTLKKISTHLPRLVKALEKLGLEVNHTTVSMGKPPDPVEISTLEQNLLDENA
ncbi:MAG: flagellar hook-length control protein FliK [Gammaproteobacteria bacterium]|nr:flagellar hook-length control protein FliK [Gammaproteobacteria bacterium]